MKFLYLQVLGCLAFPALSLAGSIDWGTALSDELFDAGGQALTSSYRFELGTFRDGFVPGSTNTGEWESKWKVIEEASFNAADQYAAENSILTASGPDLIWERDATGDENGPLSNPNLFSPGEMVFVWAFNAKAIDGTTQWALVTGQGKTANSDWRLTAAMGDALAATREWRLSNADTVFFGGLNNNRGAGDYHALPASYTLQTALLSPIPEPDTIILLAAATAISLSRRRPALNRT